MSSRLRIIVVAAASAGWCLWWGLSPDRRISESKRAIADFRAGDEHSRNRPQIGSLLYWHYHIDTFTHDTDGVTIGMLYSTACRRLMDLYPGEAKTYFWRDVFGYPRHALVVTRMVETVPYSHLVVSACENNDNTSFAFEHVKGAFDEAGKIRESNWTLPAFLK